LVAKAARWDENSNTHLLNEIQNEISRVFDGETDRPIFLDPFCGSSAIPLSAQFLGIESLATDINPVAFLISKGLLEFPSLNWSRLSLPGEQQTTISQPNLSTDRLASLFEFYSARIKQKLFENVGHLYPGSTLKYDKNSGTPSAYFWAWVVRSPNPAFSECWTPLVSTFILCNKAGKEVYIRPLINKENLSFEIIEGDAGGLQAARAGTKLGRGANFRCIYTDDPISGDYIKNQGQLGRIEIMPTAIAVDQGGRRSYVAPDQIRSGSRPYRKSISEDLPLPFNPRAFWSTPYGFDTFGSLFTERQHEFLASFASCIPQVCSEVADDLTQAGNNAELVKIATEAVATYLAALLNRIANYNSTLNSWLPKDNALGPAMPQQTIGISWGFAEANPFGKTSGSIDACTNVISSCIRACTPNARGKSFNIPVQELSFGSQKYIISTDPPYYDNIPYASLSDYFYYWSRKALKNVYPSQFATISTPVSAEIIADQYREGDKNSAEKKFLCELSKALCTLGDLHDSRFPITIYYAFKQTESDGEDGTRITGWETFLQAVCEKTESKQKKLAPTTAW
jgi:putative DNA methylase